MKLHTKQIDLTKDLNFAGGNIHLGSGRILLGDGSALGPSLSFTSDPDTGAFLAGPGEIGWTAGGNAYVYLKDDGTVEMTGTTGIAIQAGTTAERPDLPLDGVMRYNLETDTHETYINGQWLNFLFENDPHLYNPNVLQVRKNPGKGQFSSISAALASMVSPSQQNPYVINVGPGKFIEPELVIPRWVAVSGTPGSTTVEASAANQNLFHLDVNTSISHFIVRGVSGTGVAAFYVNTSNTTVTNGTYLRDIRFGNNETQVLVEQASGTYATLYVEGGMIGAHGTFKHGFEAMGPGFARINVRSLTTNGTTAPGPECLFHASGTNSTVLCTGSLFRNSQTTGYGVHLQNGATARFVGVSLLGFQKAVWLENNGAGPVFNGEAINLQSNVQDLVVDHPNATGHFLGAAERARVYVEPGADMSVFYSDPTGMGITNVGPLFLGPTHDKTSEMSGLFGRATTMGLLEGGVISESATASSVDISAGYGYASITDPIKRTTRISWSNTTLAIPSSAVVYIYVTNAGIITSNPVMPELSENILLGRVVMDETFVTWIDKIPADANHASNHIEMMLRDAFGAVYASGSTLMENATTPFALDVSSGSYYVGSLKFQPSGGTNVFMLGVHHNGASDWDYDPTMVVPHTQYDNGTGLVNMTAGYYTKHAFYVAGDGLDEVYLCVYGQSQYATLVEAEAAPLPTPPTSFNEGVTTLIASIVVKQNGTKIEKIFDQRPTLGAAAPTLAATSDHGNLLGLLDDDHPQYLLTSGARAMSGALNMGSNAISNVSTINSINLGSHGSRHLPNGADPIATGTPISISTVTANAEGTANSFARSDHTHTITGVQPSNTTLTAIAGLATNGMLAKTAAGAVATRSVAGTTNQITITNGDGVSGNPTVGLASNPVIPGTAGMVLPNGTTLQRPGTPSNGTIRYNTDASRIEIYAAGSWRIPAEVSELSAYLKLDGTSAMTGSLNMNSQNIVNSGTVNGVSVTTHASRHAPGGADAIPTASAVGLSLSSTNSEGTSTNLARADHTHTITGVQPSSALLTAYAAQSTNGITVQTSTTTVASRSIAGVAGQLTVTNGDGVAGNPTIGLVATPVAAGTYERVTVDTYGRVTSALYRQDTFVSYQMDTPNTGWPVVNVAAAYADPTYTSFNVRGFDDTRSEGLGITTDVPAGATSVKISLIGRPRTTPTNTPVAVFQVYTRRYPINGTPSAWGGAINYGNLSMAANNGTFRSFDVTFTLSALSITAGDIAQFEFVRVGGSGSDTLSGDFMVASVRMEWS